LLDEKTGTLDASLRAFNGAKGLNRAWRNGLTPDPALTVSEWADRHRVLSPRASAEPGRYRTDRTPYMRVIADALSPTHPARRIVVMKSAQVGFTECGNNWIGYVIHHGQGRCSRCSRP
jgi:phage terminase large subunit GpA-like protein